MIYSWKLVLRQHASGAIKHDFRPYMYIRRYISLRKILILVILILMHFCSLVSEYCYFIVNAATKYMVYLFNLTPL